MNNLYLCVCFPEILGQDKEGYYVNLRKYSDSTIYTDYELDQMIHRVTKLDSIRVTDGTKKFGDIWDWDGEMYSDTHVDGLDWIELDMEGCV